ncbi:MAG: ribonuclease D [Anaerolineaceae bacterium]
MSDPQSKPVYYINTPKLLIELSQVLSGQSSISIDTESNSLYVYREQVCLIQISIPEADYLLDTLALKDLSPLAPIFANPSQEKIFHAAEYDIICLRRDYGFTIANIFDTMVAARILGEPAVGLGSLLQSRLEITVNKKYQRANWGIRPLSTEMLDYARQDSQFLYPLRVILEKELKERSLFDLALEDFRLGCEAGSHSQPPTPATCWKVAGSTEVSPTEAAILQSLCDFREDQASRINVPPFKVLSNELLVQLCKEPPAEEKDLLNYRGITSHLYQRFGSKLMAAIQRGQASPPLLRPSKTRPDEHFLRRLDALKEWRKIKGKELKVESDVILPRDILEKISAENPNSLQGLHILMARVPWRYQHFSKEIFSLLRKQEVV